MQAGWPRKQAEEDTSPQSEHEALTFRGEPTAWALPEASVLLWAVRSRARLARRRGVANFLPGGAVHLRRGQQHGGLDARHTDARGHQRSRRRAGIVGCIEN